ncbi:MAG: proton-conducting transporter membrane subunit, partial [Acetobacteraceae bacterium]
RDQPMGGLAAVCWLLTMAGSIGVFITADLASFFMAYALVSLPAWGLVVLDDTGPARRAGAVYMSFAVLGETLLLMGFALLAAASPGRSLLIQDVLAALGTSPWQGATIALLIAGFGMKIALVPVHIWMPPTYRAAPIPAAAVLSGAAVKAGVIGLIRFLPLASAMPAAGEALAAVGLFGAFYGVAVGITETHPKTVLAYSSISQMGVIATVLGMGLAGGDAAAGNAAAFYGMQHVLAKGALFLAVGVAAGCGSGSRRLWPVLVPAAILALGLGGLPLTGGGLGKFAVKAVLGKGQVGGFAIASAVASTLLMVHFLRRLAAFPRQGDEAGPGLAIPWWVMAAAAIVIPWAVLPLAGGVSRAAALAPTTLWAALWPVLIGAVLSVLLFRFGNRLPELPEGDLIAVGSRLQPLAERAGRVFERGEGMLSRWPVAGIALLAVAILLGAGMFAVR